jgi:hypothetical protein
MSFQDFIISGQVKRVEKDKELAKSLLKTTKSDLIFFETWQINENSARKIVSNYYDALRSILKQLPRWTDIRFILTKPLVTF